MLIQRTRVSIFELNSRRLNIENLSTPFSILCGSITNFSVPQGHSFLGFYQTPRHEGRVGKVVEKATGEVAKSKSSSLSSSDAGETETSSTA